MCVVCMECDSEGGTSDCRYNWNPVDVIARVFRKCLPEHSTANMRMTAILGTAHILN
jgi:hypothetical protein